MNQTPPVALSVSPNKLSQFQISIYPSSFSPLITSETSSFFTPEADRAVNYDTFTDDRTRHQQMFDDYTKFPVAIDSRTWKIVTTEGFKEWAEHHHHDLPLLIHSPDYHMCHMGPEAFRGVFSLNSLSLGPMQMLCLNACLKQGQYSAIAYLYRYQLESMLSHKDVIFFDDINLLRQFTDRPIFGSCQEKRPTRYLGDCLEKTLTNLAQRQIEFSEDAALNFASTSTAVIATMEQQPVRVFCSEGRREKKQQADGRGSRAASIPTSKAKPNPRKIIPLVDLDLEPLKDNSCFFSDPNPYTIPGTRKLALLLQNFELDSPVSEHLVKFLKTHGSVVVFCAIESGDGGDFFKPDPNGAWRVPLCVLRVRTQTNSYWCRSALKGIVHPGFVDAKEAAKLKKALSSSDPFFELVSTGLIRNEPAVNYIVNRFPVYARWTGERPMSIRPYWFDCKFSCLSLNRTLKHVAYRYCAEENGLTSAHEMYPMSDYNKRVKSLRSLLRRHIRDTEPTFKSEGPRHWKSEGFDFIEFLKLPKSLKEFSSTIQQGAEDFFRKEIRLVLGQIAGATQIYSACDNVPGLTATCAVAIREISDWHFSGRERHIHLYHFFLNAICAVISIIQRIVLWLYPHAREIFRESNPGMVSEGFKSEEPNDGGFFASIAGSFTEFSRDLGSIRIISVFKRAVEDSATIFDAIVFGLQYFFEWMTFFFTGKESKFVSVTRRIDVFLDTVDSLKLSPDHDYLWSYRVHRCSLIYKKLCGEIVQIPLIKKRKFAVLCDAGKFINQHLPRAQSDLTASVTPLVPHAFGFYGPPGCGKSYFAKTYQRMFLSAFHLNEYSPIEFGRYFWIYNLDGTFHNGAHPDMKAILFDDAMQYALNGDPKNQETWGDLHDLGSGMDFSIRSAAVDDKNKTARVVTVGYCTNIPHKDFREKAGASVDTLARRYVRYNVVDEIPGTLKKLEKLSQSRIASDKEEYLHLLRTGIKFEEIGQDYKPNGVKLTQSEMLLKAKKAGWERAIDNMTKTYNELGSVEISDEERDAEKLFDNLFSDYVPEDEISTSGRLAMNLHQVVPDKETSLKTLLGAIDGVRTDATARFSSKIASIKDKLSDLKNGIVLTEEDFDFETVGQTGLSPSPSFKAQGANQSAPGPDSDNEEEDEEDYFTSLDLFKHYDTSGMIVKGLIEALLVGIAAMGIKVGLSNLFLPKEKFNSESPSRKNKKKPNAVKATSTGFAFGSEGLDPYSRTRRGITTIKNLETGKNASIFFLRPAIGIMVLHDFERVYGKSGDLHVEYNVVVQYRPRKCDYVIFQHDGENLDMIMLHVPEVVACDRIKSLPTLEHWAHGFTSSVLLQHEPGRPDLEATRIKRELDSRPVERSGLWHHYTGIATYFPESPTQGGDCGRIMVSSCKNKYSYPIGIHIAGNGEQGMIMPFVRDHMLQGVELLRKKLENAETPLPDFDAAADRVSGFVSQDSSNGMFEGGPLVDLGVVKNEFRMHSQGVTKLADSKVRLQETTMGVPRLSSPDGSHLDYVANKFCQKRSYVIDFDSLRAVSQARVAYYPFPSKHIPEVLSLEQVVCGIPDTKFVGIELSTSPGYEFNLVKRVKKLLGKGKRDFVSIEPEYAISQILLEDIECQLESLENGASVPCVYFGAEKDERLPLPDIAKGKVRLIMVGGLSYLIIFRMHFGAFCEAVTRCHSYKEFTSTIGISPFHTGEFAKLYQALKDFSSNVMEIDVRGWDKGFPVELHWAFIMCANSWYRRHYQSTDEACNKRTRVYNGTMAGAVAIGKGMFFMARGVFSGGPATTVVNTVGHDVGAHLVFHDLCNIDSMAFTVQEQQKLLLCKCFGDDGLYSTKVPEFTQKRFAKVFLERFGMEATPAGDKSSEFLDFMPVDDASFLKRSFVLVDGEIRGCLRKDVIREMCQWYRTSTSPDPEISIRQIVDSALREAFLWGQEFFEEFSLQVNHELARLGYESVNHSYSNLLSAFRNEGLASPIY